MMTTERRTSNKVFLGVATLVLMGAIGYAVQSIWSQKLDVVTFNQHVANDAKVGEQYRLDRQLDSVFHAEQSEKMDEVLCTLKPQRHKC